MMPINPMDLTDRRILVTGASSGIGKATAQLLSKLGAKVVLTARNAERLQDTLDSLEGSGHSQYLFDLSVADEIPAMMKKIAHEQGPLSGLFHSAGNVASIALTILKEKYIDHIFDSSIKAALLLTRGFCQKGVKAPYSCSIVIMSSVAGLCGFAGISMYSASKAAINGAVRSLSVELAPRGIRINSIAAGGIESVMHNNYLKNFSKEELLTYTHKHLLGFGTLGDVANAAAFLLSDAAHWITGTTLIVDGGYCCT